MSGAKKRPWLKVDQIMIGLLAAVSAKGAAVGFGLERWPAFCIGTLAIIAVILLADIADAIRHRQ